MKKVSLETAKALKDAGFPQGNIHGFWYERTKDGEWKNAILMTPQHYDKNLEYYRAVTTDELLEQLTNNQILDYCNIHDDENQSMRYLMDLYRDPNKLASCWLYLKQQNLIK